MGAWAKECSPYLTDLFNRRRQQVLQELTWATSHDELMRLQGQLMAMSQIETALLGDTNSGKAAEKALEVMGKDG